MWQTSPLISFGQPKILNRTTTSDIGDECFFKQLGRSLVGPHLNQRSQNPHVVQRGTRLAMSNVGISMTRPVNTTSTGVGRQCCHACP